MFACDLHVRFVLGPHVCSMLNTHTKRHAHAMPHPCFDFMICMTPSALQLAVQFVCLTHFQERNEKHEATSS
jgi:hypothetical protein